MSCKHKISAIIAIILFPYVLNLTNLLFNRLFCACIDFAPLLSFYGTCLGLLGSVYMYIHSQKMTHTKEILKLQPKFFVSIERYSDSNNVFSLKIINKTFQPLFYSTLYFNHLSDIVKQKYSLKISYFKSEEEARELKVGYNICEYDAWDSNDNYPKYIQITCYDEEGNHWNCCYNKFVEDGKAYYYPDEIEIV